MVVAATLDDVVVLPLVIELTELVVLVVADVVAGVVAAALVGVVVAAGAPAKMNPFNCTAHTVLEVDMYVLVVVKVDSALGWM